MHINVSLLILSMHAEEILACDVHVELCCVDTICLSWVHVFLIAGYNVARVF